MAAKHSVNSKFAGTFRFIRSNSVNATTFRLLVSLVLLTALVGCGPSGAGKVGDENDPAKTTDLKNVD